MQSKLSTQRDTHIHTREVCGLTLYTEYQLLQSENEEIQIIFSPSFILDFRLIKETGSGLCDQALLPTHRKFWIKLGPISCRCAHIHAHKQTDRGERERGQDQFLMGEQIGEAEQSSSYSPKDDLITGASPIVLKGSNCPS